MNWTVLGCGPLNKMSAYVLPITAAVHGRPLVPNEPLETLCKGLRPEQALLLLRCLSASPIERPTAAELAAALRA